MITKTLLISSITNIFLSIIKILFGYIGNSSALIADGVHSISDLGTDFVAMFGNFLSQKPADKKHPFGHGKIEYITSIVISAVIIALGFSLIGNCLDFSFAIPSLLTLIVSLFTIISKYILSIYIIHNGKKYNNNILIASGEESRMDVYSSIFVLISIILMRLSEHLIIFKYSNMIVTVLIALMIIKTGYNILKDNISILLEEQITDKEYLDKINNTILSFKEIKSISYLHILRYGPYYKMICTVIMEKGISLARAHEVIDSLEQNLKKENIQYIFIHMEPEEKQ